MTDTIKLNCLVLGDKPPTDYAFTVPTKKTNNVDELKKLIKAEKDPELNHIAANSLILWKVSIPGDDRKKLAKKMAELEAQLPALAENDDDVPLQTDGIQRLEPLKKLSHYFSYDDPPADEHVHIIVQPPPPPPASKRAREESQEPEYLARAKRSKLVQIAPSTIATTSNYTSLQEDPNERILDDRPEQEQNMAPIALLYDGFGRFEDIVDGRSNVAGAELIDQYKLEEAVDAFATAMQKIYSYESGRQTEAIPLLNDIFSARKDGVVVQDMMPASLPSISKTPHDVRTDGHNYGPHGAILVIQEIKNEMCGTKSIPVVELVGYAARANAHAMKKHPTLYRSWRVPTLGIVIVGPYVQFVAVIFLDMHRLVALTPMLPVVSHAGDLRARYMLYNAFKAACVLRADIERDIHTRMTSPTPLPEIPISHRRFPSVTQASVWPPTPSTITIPFSITELYSPQSNRFLYRATSRGDDVLVKFTRRYSTQLHAFCAEQNRAPKLLGFQELPGGWLLIVMEYVPSVPISHAHGLQGYLQEWKSDMEALVDEFHSRNLVHGDLRDANIIITDDDKHKAVLIDFDWAGKEGEVAYPTERLNPDLSADRISADLFITKEDDKRVLRRTFSKLEASLRIARSDV